jgi:putative copper resistance protein D
MILVEAAGVVARLAQFAGAAVLGGGALFFIYGVTPDRRTRWPFGLIRIAAGLGLIGTIGWLMTQTAQIGDAPSDALDAAKVWSVAAQTGFGRVALVRVALFLIAFAATFALRPGRGAWLALAGLGAAASASFAGTGHGARDEGLPGILHLTADVLHLLAASIWIGALAGLAGVVALASRSTDAGAGCDALTGLVRFSGIGIAVVAILVGSGLVNSWFLIGPTGLRQVLTSPYGQILVAKLALFGLMLALAAANRYRHTPRLELALQNVEAGGAPFRPVVSSVLTETVLAVAVLALVSWLGTLSPPIDA